MPVLGTLAGDRDAYSYLPESVRSFPPPEGLAAMMDEAGLEAISYTILAGGIIAIHSATKPVRRPGMNRSAVPPPVTQVMDAASAWLPACDGRRRGAPHGADRRPGAAARRRRRPRR